MRIHRHFLFVSMLVFAAALCYAAQEKTGTMSVQVKTGQLRESPSFLGKITAPLAYGEKVTKVMQKGEWLKVSTARGVVGWVHGSAVSVKTIKMTAGSEDAKVAASGDEMVLAGKGFNKEVEADFKAKNQNLDYAWVDSMGAMVVTPREITAFVKDGNLQPKEAE